jgi:hypothetical protein
MAGYEENSKKITRRDTLKAAVAVAGASAFATPVVAGVFSTRVSAAQCNPKTDSFVIEGTGIDGSQSWNQNCGQPTGNKVGRYNGQDQPVKLAGGNGTVTVRVGDSGTDNRKVNVSYYVIDSNDFECTATFTLTDCGGLNEATVLYSVDDGTWPPGAKVLPWCHVCPQDQLTQQSQQAAQNRLVLAEVFCCPK